MEYKLGDIAIFIRNGANIKNDKSKGGIPITRIETISDGIVNENKMGYADIIDDRYKDYYLKQNDILMSHINSAKHLGKVAIFNEDKKIIHGMNLLDIRLNNAICNSKYVYYFFKTKRFKQQLNRISKQSVNQSSFTVNDLKDIKISLPLLENQKIIANKLDKVQAIIDLRKKQIEELDELIKSKFVEMFEDKEYSQAKLQQLIDLKYITYHLDGNHGSLYPRSSEFISEGVPYVGANCIIDSKINFENAKYLSKERAKKFKKGIAQNEDVLFANNATVGPVALLHTEEPYIILSTSLTAYRCNKEKINPYYLKEFMKSDFFVSQYINEMKQTTRAQLPITTQRKYNFIIPPIELQNEFAEFVKIIDRQKLTIEKSLKETEELQESLMNKYFN